MGTIVHKYGLANFWSQFFSRKADSSNEEDVTELELLLDEIDKSHREWLLAKTYFEQVSEPELIDHAIHWMMAAEKKYMYLMNKAREYKDEKSGSNAVAAE